MLDAIERFATTYEHTVRLLGVFGTFSAVAVSLWLARRAARIRLKATARLAPGYGQQIDPHNPPTFLAVNVTNTGSMTLRVSAALKWKAPLRRGYITQPSPPPLVPPSEFSKHSAILGQPRWPILASEVFYFCDKAGFQAVAMSNPSPIMFQRSSYNTNPLEIAPRASEAFFICDKAQFQAVAKDILRANNSYLDRLRFWLIRAWVQTDDGKKFRVKLSKEVRDIWRSARE